MENDARSWIVREKDKRDNPTSYPEFPHPDAKSVTLHLQGNAPERGHLSTQRKKASQETLVDNYSFDGKALAIAEYTNHRLMYVTPELKEDIHISGVPEVKINLASNKPAANLSVWLVSLPWNEGRFSKITDNVITRGWADPQNHSSLTKSEPLTSGKFYTVKFDLQPDDQIIKAGQQIGLMIFSSDREYTLWPKPGTELTIDCANTTLTIPVVGGEAAFKKATN